MTLEASFASYNRRALRDGIVVGTGETTVRLDSLGRLVVEVDGVTIRRAITIEAAPLRPSRPAEHDRWLLRVVRVDVFDERDAP